TPSNGARMVFCAIRARWASAWARVWAASLVRSSTSAWETSFCPPSSRQRSRWVAASRAAASSAFSWASSLAVFNCTSRSPLRTRCPDSNAMRWTTPPASVVTWVPLSATRVPTASAVSLQFSARASKVLTCTAGCGMLSKKSLSARCDRNHSTNTPPNTTANRISIRVTRRPVEGGRRVDCGLLSLIGIPLRQVVRERHRGRRGRGGVRWRVLRRQGLQCGGAGARTGRKGRFWTWSGCLCNDRGSGRRLGHNRPPPVSACRMPMSAPASPRRILFASLIGTTIEFFDFYIYATAAVLVFPKLFFPASEPTAATLQSLATFALAFLARPLGSAVFGHYGDRIGRKATLVAALLTMGIS